MIPQHDKSTAISIIPLHTLGQGTEVSRSEEPCCRAVRSAFWVLYKNGEGRNTSSQLKMHLLKPNQELRTMGEGKERGWRARQAHRMKDDVLTTSI